jgi:hypothetical protein
MIGVRQLVIDFSPVVDQGKLAAVACSCLVENTADATCTVGTAALRDESISAALDSIK